MASFQGKLDEETSEVLSEGSELTELVKSRGWSIVKRKLHERILDIGNILSLSREGKTNEDLIAELGVRQTVIEITIDWLKDIEGSAFQHKTNEEAMRSIMEEDYLQRVKDSEDTE